MYHALRQPPAICKAYGSLLRGDPNWYVLLRIEVGKLIEILGNFRAKATVMADAFVLDWESATASIVAPVPDSTLDQDPLTSKTPVTPKSRLDLDTETTHVETVTDHNMVLFVSSRFKFSSL